MELKKITEKPILETATDDTHVLVTDNEGVKRMPASAVGGGFKDVVIDATVEPHTLTYNGITLEDNQMGVCTVGIEDYDEYESFKNFVENNDIKFVVKALNYGDEIIDISYGYVTLPNVQNRIYFGNQYSGFFSVGDRDCEDNG